MPDKQLIIFDWDGTLMDSVNHIVDSMRHAINIMDLEPRSTEQLRDIIGLGMKEAIYQLYPNHQSEQFAQQFSAAYRENFFIEQAPQALFEGAEATLQTLIDENYLLAVATSKSRRGLDKVMTETGLGDYFVTSRCADETRSKPHPQMLLEILESQQIAADQAIMVGDTVYDLEMAIQARVLPIGVSYGVHDTERLNKFKPAHILDRISDLPEWLQNR